MAVFFFKQRDQLVPVGFHVGIVEILLSLNFVHLSLNCDAPASPNCKGHYLRLRPVYEDRELTDRFRWTGAGNALLEVRKLVALPKLEGSARQMPTPRVPRT